MGQFQVYEILKRNKDKWLSCKDISLELDINQTTINVSLKKLYDYGWIYREESSILTGGRFYVYKYKKEKN